MPSNENAPATEVHMPLNENAPPEIPDALLVGGQGFGSRLLNYITPSTANVSVIGPPDSPTLPEAPTHTPNRAGRYMNDGYNTDILGNERNIVKIGRTSEQIRLDTLER